MRVTALVTVPPARASPGYEMWPGLGYYKFHPEMHTFDDAARTCTEEGAHLAVLNSDAEAAVAKQLFARHPKAGDWAFLGFHDKLNEGQYVTIFGEPLSESGFYKWAGGQPDNAGGNPGEDCGSMHRSGGLNDLPCKNFKAAFLCEQEL